MKPAAMVAGPRCILIFCPAVPSNNTIAILLALVIEGVRLWPIDMRAVYSTSATVRGGGGIKKSPAAIAVPSGVAIEILLETVVETRVTTVVELAEVICACVLLNFTLLSAAVAAKLVPESVTSSPRTPMVGVKLLITGAPACPTVNDEELLAEPFGLLTVIGPVVAPEGTTATSLVVVAEVTVAAVALNWTVF